MTASIAQGHVDLADVLFLVAFVAFVVSFVVRVIAKPRPLDALGMAAGAALIALAFFVL